MRETLRNYGRILSGGILVGIFYSLLFPLTGPRFLHFVPTFLVGSALLHGLLVAILLFIFKKFLHSFFRSMIVVAGLLFVHFSVWIWCFSSWPRGSYWTKFAAVLVFFATLALGIFVRKWKLSGIRINRVEVLGVLSIILLFSLYFTVNFVSLDMLRKWSTIKVDNIKTKTNLSRKILYPFSVPIEEGINTYSFILPSLPEGEKAIVIVLDAFRGDYLGKELEGISVTPNMHRLADENLYFPNYRVQAPWTKASVASFFTGHYVRDHATFVGAQNEKQLRDSLRDYREQNLGDRDHLYSHVLPEKFRTLAERLAGEGFTNAGFIAMAPITEQLQFDQGFSYYGTKTREDFVADVNLSRALLYWLLRSRPENTFLYLHLLGPHYPYNGADRNKAFWRKTNFYRNGKLDLKKWDLPPIDEALKGTLRINRIGDFQYEVDFIRHLYAADLNFYDRYLLPRFFEGLDQLNFPEEGLIAVTSDHGEGLFDHDNFFGHTENLYEESIRVPLIVQLPETYPVKSATKTGWNLESLDLTATILDYAGAPRTDLPGDSFLPYLEDNSGTHPFNTAFSEKGFVDRIHKAAVVHRKNKLIRNYIEDRDLWFELKEGAVEDEELKDPELRRDLLDRLDKTLGLGPELRSQPAPPKALSGSQKEELEGLGYLE